MNYNEFINAYKGKSFDYDGVSGVQCVDLVKQYLNKVFGIKPGSWGNAKDYYEDYNSNKILKANFTRIANTPEFVPKKGDIAVWGTGLGNKYGHIAIATGEGTTSYFYSYDLNWNGKTVKKVKHTYKGFLGVLRAKDQEKITGTINKVKFTVGKTYTTQVNLKVRTGAGTDKSQKKTSQLTVDGQKNALKQELAVLKKGTKVTCKAVKNIDDEVWIQIPSGWIAAYYDKKQYVK